MGGGSRRRRSDSRGRRTASRRPPLRANDPCGTPCLFAGFHEIFGPVTCVYGFTGLRQAITQANSLPFAFQASIFSRDIDSALQAAKHLAASAVMVNDHTAFRTDWMPFAGQGQSGLGTGGIQYTMDDMLQNKMILLRHCGGRPKSD